MAEMNTMLQRDVPGATFEPWDWWYYAAKRCARTNMRSTMLRCGPIFRSKMFGKALFAGEPALRDYVPSVGRTGLPQGLLGI